MNTDFSCLCRGLIEAHFTKYLLHYCMTGPIILNLWTCNGQFQILIFHNVSFVVTNTDFSCLYCGHIAAHFHRVYKVFGALLYDMTNNSEFVDV